MDTGERAYGRWLGDVLVGVLGAGATEQDLQELGAWDDPEPDRDAYLEWEGDVDGWVRWYAEQYDLGV